MHAYGTILIRLPANSFCLQQHISTFEANQKGIEDFSITHACWIALLSVVYDPEIYKLRVICTPR